MLKEEFMFIVCLNLIKSLNSNMEAFVVKGKPTRIENFPHSVYLESFCGTKITSKCGSSLLNHRILITAAHCMPLNNCSSHISLTAQFGHEDKTKGIKTGVSSYILHEDYESSDYILKCDIALVLLEKPVQLSSKISRVAIMRNAVRDGEIVTMAGWGYVDVSSPQITAG